MAEPLKATFFAFRKREQSGVLLRASIAFVVIGLALLAGFVALFWSSLGPVMTWYGEVIAAAVSNDTAAMQSAAFPSALGVIVLGVLVWSLFFYILCAAFEAACLRWMIRGETGGFMGLTLGADTWRVWAVYWMWFLLYLAFSMVMSIVMMVILGFVTVGASGDPTATLTALPVFYLLQYGLMIYFGVRFAPAAAASVARRKFAFFDAWKVTRGRFWALFGSFFLLCLLYAIAGIAMMSVWFSVALAPNLPDLAALTDPSQAEVLVGEMMQAYIRTLLQPQTWILLGVLQVVGWVVAVLFYVAMYGVNARAAQAALDEGKIQPAAAQ